MPYGANPATCPVRAVRALVATLAEAGRTSGPLLVRIDRRGRINPPLTRGGRLIGDPDGRMSSDVVTRIATAAKLEGRWTGHSLRRGFATAARRAPRPRRGHLQAVPEAARARAGHGPAGAVRGLRPGPATRTRAAHRLVAHYPAQ
ncbi:site-specific integrase [Sphaerisporangium aureirubrum]|uniref:Tyr recombinase domain-containing protein n=1 Tax=Sphaerisporangium aureirubrum TaxID=1544736 RepID=A0ABW1NFG1_9ACTN